MIKTSIEKVAEEIGFDIANSDDITQGKLLNGFCSGLRDSMQDHALEMQLCYISRQLNPKSENVIKALAEFIELKNKD